METPMDGATRVAKDLIEAIKKLRGLEKNHPGRHTTALEALAKIFKGETEHVPVRAGPEPQTSTNPTQPKEIRTTPRVHTKRTRNNTPGILPTIDESHTEKPTTEGVEGTVVDKSPSQEWYAEPRKKRTRVRKAQQQRKSPRLHNQSNVPVEATMIKQDMFEYEQQDENKVYGLGVPKQQTIQCNEDPTPTSTPNNTGQNAIPTFRSPMIIPKRP